MTTTNEQSTTQTSLPPSATFSSSEIPKSIIKSFQSELTFQKLSELQSKLHKNEKKGRISLSNFLPIMINTFGHNKSHSYLQLYKQIYLRFQTIKCSIINNKSKYYLTSLQYSDLSTYELISALTMFLKTDFKTKLKLLFDLTDPDEDGYLTENEIKKLIIMINIIFADQLSPIKTFSTIINQSLVNIHNEQILNDLFYKYGNLQEIFDREKAISFNDFYKAIIKIPSYKFKILPCYYTMKDCLKEVKNVKEIYVRNDNRNEFISITNEIMSTVRHENINDSSTKKRSSSMKCLLHNTQRTLNQKNKRNTLYSARTRNNSILFGTFRKTINSSNDCNQNKTFTNFNNRSNRIYQVNMNTLQKLEIHPMIVKFVNKKNQSKIMSVPKVNNSNKDIPNKIIGNTLIRRRKRRGSTFIKMKNNHSCNNSYMTYDEIMSEINMNIKRRKDEMIKNFKMNSIEDGCKEIASSMRNTLSDKSEYNWKKLMYKQYEIQTYGYKPYKK